MHMCLRLPISPLLYLSWRSDLIVKDRQQYPTLMMRALSVLDFIFMVILLVRCLTFFMRCSLHENGGVHSYFIY